MLCRELNFLVCFYEINKIYICANLAVYPGSDNVPDEILSISGEIEPVRVDTFRNEKKRFQRIEIETPGGSQQSSFSLANNENVSKQLINQSFTFVRSESTIQSTKFI